MKVRYKGIVALLVVLMSAGCGTLFSNSSSQSTAQNSAQTPVQQSSQPALTPSNQPSVPNQNNENPSKSTTPQIKTDTARYNGQIDAASIEVTVSGSTEGKGIYALRLGDKLRETFDSYRLNTGDTIKFTYYVNEHGQKVITSLEVISNK